MNTVPIVQAPEWSSLCQWADSHYRCRTFGRDARIPTRPGLIYITLQGVVRMVSLTPDNHEVFVGFLTAGSPFEVTEQDRFELQAVTQVDGTTVMWFYWQDLQQWPRLHQRLHEEFRYQLQRKLLWLGNLGQRRAIDRLRGFLTLIVEEHGEPYQGGMLLPWTLTHAQIGDAIGATRVTVTRLLGTLRNKGFVQILDQNQMFLPHAVHLPRHARTA